MTEIPKELVNWLDKCGCTDLQPVKVLIGNQTWIGCRYTRVLHYTASMMAVTHGDKKADDTYTENRIYVIGKLPKGYFGRPKQCYPFEENEWYVSGYMPLKNMTPEVQHFHPFGINFILAPWDIKDSKVDDGEIKPYKRIPMQVENL